MIRRYNEVSTPGSALFDASRVVSAGSYGADGPRRGKDQIAVAGRGVHLVCLGAEGEVDHPVRSSPVAKAARGEQEIQRLHPDGESGARAREHGLDFRVGLWVGAVAAWAGITMGLPYGNFAFNSMSRRTHPGTVGRGTSEWARKTRSRCLRRSWPSERYEAHSTSTRRGPWRRMARHAGLRPARPARGRCDRDDEGRGAPRRASTREADRRPAERLRRRPETPRHLPPTRARSTRMATTCSPLLARSLKSAGREGEQRPGSDLAVPGFP